MPFTIYRIDAGSGKCNLNEQGAHLHAQALSTVKNDLICGKTKNEKNCFHTSFCKNLQEPRSRRNSIEFEFLCFFSFR